jgi:hypothetical protein
MVGRKEDEDQIDRGRANLHENSIREIASGGFRIGLARECGCELKCGLSRRACVMSRHGMKVLSIGRRYVSRLLKKARLLTRPTLARRDAPCPKQGRSE